MSEITISLLFKCKSIYRKGLIIALTDALKRFDVDEFDYEELKDDS